MSASFTPFCRHAVQTLVNHTCVHLWPTGNIYSHDNICSEWCEKIPKWIYVCFKLNRFCMCVCVCACAHARVFDGAISWSRRRMVLDQALIIQWRACSNVIGWEAGSMMWLKGHYGHVQSTYSLRVDRCIHTHTQNKTARLDSDTSSHHAQTDRTAPKNHWIIRDVGVL